MRNYTVVYTAGESPMRGRLFTVRLDAANEEDAASQVAGMHQDWFCRIELIVPTASQNSMYARITRAGLSLGAARVAGMRYPYVYQFGPQGGLPTLTIKVSVAPGISADERNYAVMRTAMRLGYKLLAVKRTR
jgi:hypothetical protein